MTNDHTALIAEARREAKGWRSVNTGNAALSWGKAQLLDRLADALEQVTAELRQEREDHRSAHDALVFMAIELGWATDGRLATAVGHAKEVLRVRTAERDAAYTAIREALTHDPLHGKTWGLHCGGMAPCIRAILSRIPTEEA